MQGTYVPARLARHFEALNLGCKTRYWGGSEKNYHFTYLIDTKGRQLCRVLELLLSKATR